MEEYSFQGSRAIHVVIKGVAKQPSIEEEKIVDIVHDITRKGVKLDASMGGQTLKSHRKLGKF